MDNNKQSIFIDPSVYNEGPSSALIRTNIFQDWLEKNNYHLLWLVGGEKQLFTEDASKFHGRLVYSGIYKLTSKGIKGSCWFKKEPASE